METHKKYPLKAQRSISHTLIVQAIGSQIIHIAFLLEHLYVYISKGEEAFRQKIFSAHFGDCMLRCYPFFYQKIGPHLWPKTNSLTTYTY